MEQRPAPPSEPQAAERALPALPLLSSLLTFRSSLLHFSSPPAFVSLPPNCPLPAPACRRRLCTTSPERRGPRAPPFVHVKSSAIQRTSSRGKWGTALRVSAACCLSQPHDEQGLELGASGVAHTPPATVSRLSPGRQAPGSPLARRRRWKHNHRLRVLNPPPPVSAALRAPAGGGLRGAAQQLPPRARALPRPLAPS